MPGPIFAHVQTFAQKENQGGQFIAQVIGEGLREPKFSRHVDAPKPPRVLFGNPATFVAEHDTHVAARATKVDTKKGPKVRAIRVDRHTMATTVASYPLTHFQVARRPDGQERLAEWEAMTVEWIRARWGDQVRTVFAHDDEEHPHIHAWFLPDDPDAFAVTLHPGKVAKAEEEERLKREGVPKKEALRLGDKALKEAMGAFLDDYWREVGVPCGMTRDGPKRGRLIRAEHLARKAEAERMRQAHRAAKEQADDALELRAAATEKAAQVQADRQALDQEEALAAVTEQIEDGIALAVSLVADGSLRMTPRGVDVPPEHRAALRPVWPLIGPAMGQMMTLRDRRTRGITRLRDLLTRNKVAAELREEARQIIEESPGRL